MNLYILNHKLRKLEKTPLFNLTKLQDMSRGNDEFVNRLVKTFIIETEKSLTVLEEHVKELNYDGIKAIVHKMKPSTEMMGINTALENIKIIQNNVDSNSQLEIIPSLFSEMKNVYLMVFDALKRDYNQAS